LKKQATLVDPARKRNDLLYSGPRTTRARLLATRFARFLSPALGRRRHRKSPLHEAPLFWWVLKNAQNADIWYT